MGDKGALMPPKYKVAIIGTGFAERVQIPGFQRHPRFEIVAIAGQNPKRTQEVAKKFGIEKWYTNWHELVRVINIPEDAISASIFFKLDFQIFCEVWHGSIDTLSNC